MASRLPSSNSSAPPPLAPSRRISRRAHSDSYHPIYSASSSASSDTSSIFSHGSSSSSATSASTSRRAVSHNVPREHARPSRAPSTLSGSVSVPLCSPEAGTTKIALPRTLVRPKLQAVSREALAAAGADLENVPLAYIIQSLKDIGPRMMATLARTTAPAPTTLPHDLEVHVVPDPEHDPDMEILPTHLLAVYTRSNLEVAPARDGVVSRRKVTLFPTHAVMLAAHCAHLPPLPPGGKRNLRESEDDLQMVQDEGQVTDLSRPTGGVQDGGKNDEHIHQNGVQNSDSKHQIDNAKEAENPQPTPEPAANDNKDARDSGQPFALRSMEPRASHIALTLPVVPLCIPAPKMFPVLQAYLYNKRADHLFGALIPSPNAPSSIPTPTPTPLPFLPLQSRPLSPAAPSPPTSESDSTPRPSPAPSTPTPSNPQLPPLVPDAAALSAQLAALHDTPALVHAALRTHGVWADAAALGVFDERLWLTIDFAWRVLLGALDRGGAQVPMDTSSDEDEDEDSEEAEDESIDEEGGEGGGQSAVVVSHCVREVKVQAETREGLNE